MNQENIGKFIAELRKEKKLTQEELAERLKVNSKSVSRWENGRTMPDLSMIQELAQELNVNVSELLNGRRMDKKELVKLKETVNNLLLCYQKENKQNNKKIIKLISVFLLSGSFIASMVSLICDYLINKTFCWSLIVVLSITCSLTIIIPLLKLQQNYIKKSLMIITGIIIPYLAGLSLILNESLIIKIGIPISLVSIIYLWLTYLIYKLIYKRKHMLFLFIGIALILLIPLPIIIIMIASLWVNTVKLNIWDISFNTCLTFILAMIFIGLEYYVQQKKTK